MKTEPVSIQDTDHGKLKRSHGNLQSHNYGGKCVFFKALQEDEVGDEDNTKEEQETGIQSLFIIILLVIVDVTKHSTIEIYLLSP